MFKLDKSIVEKTGFNPYYPVIQSFSEDSFVIDNIKYINFASNNYLGLANDKRVKEAAKNALDKYGVSLCGTPIATGYIDLYKRVEENFSQFIGLEDSIILPSCYQANNGIFSILAQKDDVIIVDHYAHSSLIQGIKSVGCKIKPFLHNDLEHLHKVLNKSTQFNKKFVVTESVFSTEGSIAPLKKIVALCKKFNAIPIVDDSHGIGVIGKNGRGILEEQEINNFDGIYTTSLGKAIANLGGVISGNKETIEYLRYYFPHLIYSTALPPVILGGIEKVLEIIEKEFTQMSKKLWEIKNIVGKNLKNAGFDIVNSFSPINSILGGSSENTILIAKKFYSHKILTTPFIEPSVPKNEGKVRLIAAANLKEETLDKFLNVLKKIGSN